MQEARSLPFIPFCFNDICPFVRSVGCIIRPRLRLCCLEAGVWGREHSRQSGSFSPLWEDPVLLMAFLGNCGWSSTNTKYRITYHFQPLQGWMLTLSTHFIFYLTDNTVNFQVLPQDSVVSESGELTELGRSYVPPRVLLDALCVVCSSASQWGDPAEAESLAMETLIVSHHPSIGTWFSLFDNPEVCCYSALVVVAASEMSHSTFIFFSGSLPWPLACSPLLHELESWRVHRKQPGGYSPTAAQSRCRQPGLTIVQLHFLYSTFVYTDSCRKWWKNRMKRLHVASRSRKGDEFRWW